MTVRPHGRPGRTPPGAARHVCACDGDDVDRGTGRVVAGAGRSGRSGRWGYGFADTLTWEGVLRDDGGPASS